MRKIVYLLTIVKKNVDILKKIFERDFSLEYLKYLPVVTDEKKYEFWDFYLGNFL